VYQSQADSLEATDWSQILALYDQLLAITPTPVVAMNRAIALSEVLGPQAALDILDGLDLGGYPLFHATRADVLARLGRTDDAAKAYARAAELATTGEEQAFLRRRLATVGPFAGENAG
jgi:RNA polymerase sigma-70 factor (ECF subfamily)